MLGLGVRDAGGSSLLLMPALLLWWVWVGVLSGPGMTVLLLSLGVDSTSIPEAKTSSSSETEPMGFVASSHSISSLITVLKILGLS